MAGTADGESDIDDLREELTCELDVLLRDLKGLGYDMNHMQYFLQETRALETAAQIPKLQKQFTRLQKIKEHILACVCKLGRAGVP
jgi:hypothetical protein